MPHGPSNRAPPRLYRAASAAEKSAEFTVLREWYRGLPPRSANDSGGTPSGPGAEPWSAKPLKFNSLISFHKPYLSAYGALPWTRHAGGVLRTTGPEAPDPI